MGNPRNAYFDDHEWLSNSMLKVADRKPSLYEAMFITHTLPDPPPTDPMIVGSMTHSLVFEPENLGDDWAIHDFNPRKGKAWDQYKFANVDKMLFRRQDMKKCEDMADAARRHKTALTLIEADGALAEHVIRWEQDGIKRKAKLDLLVPLTEKHCIVCDLKTTTDGRPLEYAWPRDCRKRNYHRQAAWYSDAARSLGYTQVDWVYIIVENEAPYDVYVTQAPEGEILAGEIENGECLRRWNECRETGIWQRPEQSGMWPNPQPSWA